MPLWKRHPFPLVQPPRDLSPSDEVFVIRFTSECFRSYKNYIQRLEKYRERVWTCKITGKSNLTYEEALLSERRVSESIEFPEAILRDLVEQVHLNVDNIELIVDRIYEIHKSELIKQNGSQKSLTKPLIKKKLREIADKDLYKGAPWMIVDRRLIERFSLNTQLPISLQRLKEEYDKKHKRELLPDTEETVVKKKKPRVKKDVEIPLDEEIEHNSDLQKPIPSQIKYPHDMVNSIIFIWRFCVSFGKFLSLNSFLLDDLAEAIFHIEETDLLIQIFTSLLKVVYPKNISKENWKKNLIDLFETEKVNVDQRVLENLAANYSKLDSKEKSNLLEKLIEFITDEESFHELIDDSVENTIELKKEKRELEVEAKRLEKKNQSFTTTDLHQRKQKINENFEKKFAKHSVRDIPLGIDRDYCRYWSFGDGRLYVEDPSSHPPTWAFYHTTEEVDQLMEYLDVSGRREKALHQQLTEKYSRLLSAPLLRPSLLSASSSSSSRRPSNLLPPSSLPVRRSPRLHPENY